MSPKRTLPQLLTTLALIFMLGVVINPARPVSAVTHTVTSLGDSGPDSLRGTIASANANDIIVFASTLSGQVIQLDSQLVLNKNLTIDGSSLASPITISGNSAHRVFMVQPGVTATIDSLVITKGFSDYGGGIFNAGILHLFNTTITENSATTHAGGVYNTGHLTITNSEVSGNTAGYLYLGGGIYNENEATLEITGSRILSNRAESGVGGGIYNASSAGDGVLIIDSTLSDNTASSGGGICNTGSIVLTGVTLTGNNVSGEGGGVYNEGLLVAVNSTFSGNTAVNYGGGISNRISPGSLKLTNCTVYGNTGGGVRNLNGTLEAYNTLMVASKPHDCSSNIDVIGHHNLVAINALEYECFEDYPGDPDDPLLVEKILGDNDGPTFTHALPIGSPAIDAGDLYLCPKYDQRGVKRPQDWGCDIGAFELEGIVHTGYTLTTNIDPLGTGSISIIPDQLTYDFGDEVILTAIPEPDWAFDSWSGDASGTDNLLIIRIQDDTIITANFIESLSNIFLPLILR